MEASRLGGPVFPFPMLYCAGMGHMADADPARTASSIDGESTANDNFVNTY